MIPFIDHSRELIDHAGGVPDGKNQVVLMLGGAAAGCLLNSG